MKRILFGLLLAGCSRDGARAVDAATQPASMILTSPAFAEGAPIPVANTCHGADTSPALAWTGAPSGTQSFAVVLTDASISLTHWVIYDIPAPTTGLPADVEKLYAPSNVLGAHQTESIQASTVGYSGPCPPMQAHIYQFAVYALDTAQLPGTSASTMRPEAIAEIQAHRLDSGTLTGTYGL